MPFFWGEIGLRLFYAIISVILFGTAKNNIICNAYTNKQKTFQTKVRLNNHIKLKHTGGDKQFACDECGSMFKQKKYLNAHICCMSMA